MVVFAARRATAARLAAAHAALHFHAAKGRGRSRRRQHQKTGDVHYRTRSVYCTDLVITLPHLRPYILSNYFRGYCLIKCGIFALERCVCGNVQVQVVAMSPKTGAPTVAPEAATEKYQLTDDGNQVCSSLYLFIS